MQEFLTNLYEIENFTTYLSIAIAVLVVLFFLVLFLGKKDQKLEETKKLQKLEMDSFKETSEAVKMETSKIENQTAEETTSIPVLDTSDLIVTDDTVSMPAIKELPEESTLAALQDLTDGNIELPKIKEPVIEEVNEVKPMLDEIMQDEENEPISLSEITMPTEEHILPKEKELPKFSEVIPNEEMVLPEFNFDDVISSLNEETIIESKKEEITEVPELPSIPTLTDYAPELIVKEELPKKPIGQPIFSSVYVTKKEEDNIIDLTNIGQEVKSESKNVENNTSFDSILGETYNIK